MRRARDLGRTGRPSLRRHQPPQFLEPVLDNYQLADSALCNKTRSRDHQEPLAIRRHVEPPLTTRLGEMVEREQVHWIPERQRLRRALSTSHGDSRDRSEPTAWDTTRAGLAASPSGFRTAWTHTPSCFSACRTPPDTGQLSPGSPPVQSRWGCPDPSRPVDSRTSSGTPSEADALLSPSGCCPRQTGQ